MSKKCIIRYCGTSAKNKNGLFMHRFPNHNRPESLKAWEDFVNTSNGTESFKAYAGAVLCSAHFEPTCYKSEKRLELDAVPTKLLELPRDLAFKRGLVSSLEDLPILPSCSTENNKSLSENICPEESFDDDADCVPLIPFEDEEMDSVFSDHNYVKVPAKHKGCDDAMDSGPVESSILGDITNVSTPSQGVTAPQVKTEKECATPEVGKSVRYIGDLSPGDFATPRRSKKHLNFVKNVLGTSKHTLRMSQQRLRRAFRKISDMKTLIKHLLEAKKITEDAAKIIEVHTDKAIRACEFAY